jgi:hypothetical protein
MERPMVNTGDVCSVLCAIRESARDVLGSARLALHDWKGLRTWSPSEATRQGYKADAKAASAACLALAVVCRGLYGPKFLRLTRVLERHAERIGGSVE